MKKIIAMFLAAAVTISLFGCATVNGNAPIETACPNTETTPGNHDHDHDPGDETIGDAGSTETAAEAPAESTAEAPTEAATEDTEVPADTTPEATEPPETGHTHSYTTKVIAPTCTEKGYTKYTCSCGDSYTSDEKPATGHDYKATTIAPTEESQGYDLYTCTKCGYSYKDNYKDKLPGDDDDHTGKYYDEGSGKWVAWDCASKGHRWGGQWSSKPPKTIREATCCQLKIVEYYCEVGGCNGSEQREIANSYASHKRSVDTMTGLVHQWQVRMISGGSFYYTAEEHMKANVRTLVDEYKSGKRTDWVEYIREYYTATFTDTYVCLECGQTLNNSSRYTWVGEPPYKGYDISMVYYTKDNQPDF